MSKLRGGDPRGTARRNLAPRAGAAVARVGDGVRSTQRPRAARARRDIAVRARAAQPSAASGTGGGSLSAVVVASASMRGKGRFHWFDLCLGHYWDTAALRH
jgi:hypothetical protein